MSQPFLMMVYSIFFLFLEGDGLQGQQPSAQGNALGISNRQMRNGGL
jgi:hypothetical protein